MYIIPQVSSGQTQFTILTGRRIGEREEEREKERGEGLCGAWKHREALSELLAAQMVLYSSVYQSWGL